MSTRTFIALDTPDIVRRALIELQSKLKEAEADVKWEPKEKLHATIKFIGNVEENNLSPVTKTIEECLKNVPKFEVRYSRLGCFPSSYQPRVIWIGCENTDGMLARIKESLDHVLLAHGFKKEERDFHPHVTLGRVKSSRRIKNLIPLLQSVNFQPNSTICHEILLMKSVLKSQGSEYSTIRSFPLT